MNQISTGMLPSRNLQSHKLIVILVYQVHAPIAVHLTTQINKKFYNVMLHKLNGFAGIGWAEV